MFERRNRSFRPLASFCALVFAGLGVLSGCHTDLGLDSTVFECKQPADCMEGWECSPDGVCVEAGSVTKPTDTGTDTDTDVADSGGDTDSGTDGDAQSDADIGTDGDVAEPECENNDDCADGYYCNAAQECAAGCEQEREPCDPSTRDQGKYVCVQEGANTGTCLLKCHVPQTQSNCPASSYCASVDGVSNACMPDMCLFSQSCPEGTKCIAMTPSVGWCIEKGSMGVGEACELNVEPCEEDGLCTSEPTASGSVCRATCDLWASPSQCAPSQVCQYVTAQTGVCVSPIVVNGGTPNAFEPCPADQDGAACGDGSVCMSDPRPQQSSDSFSCMPLCRPGKGDCPDSHDGAPIVCDTFANAGRREIGLCVPKCVEASDCNELQICQAGNCRYPCEHDNDCPDDQPWVCGDEGLCE